MFKVNPWLFIVTPALNSTVDKYEVVSIHQDNLNAFKRWYESVPWVSVLKISPQDAYKLLQANNGIGVGCIAFDGLNEPTGAKEQARIARMKLKALMELAKGINIQPLTIIKKPIIKEEPYNEVLTINYKGSNNIQTITNN